MFLCWSQLAQRHGLLGSFLSAFRTAIQEFANMYLPEFHGFRPMPAASLRLLFRFLQVFC